MDDLISRQAAINLLKKWSDGYRYIETDTELAIKEFQGLPFAQPEDKCGECDAWNQYKNYSRQRWIPCSERLPEEHESIWAKAKGTDRWSEAMWEKQSDEVIVTELFEDGTTRTDTACTHDGEWYVRVKMVKRKIIAWMPLPEPARLEGD